MHEVNIHRLLPAVAQSSHVHDIRREADGDQEYWGYEYYCANDNCPGFDDYDIIDTFDLYLEGNPKDDV